MSSNKDLRRAKHAAYEKKQAAKGEKVDQVDIWCVDSFGYYLRYLCIFYRIIYEPEMGSYLYL